MRQMRKREESFDKSAPECGRDYVCLLTPRCADSPSVNLPGFARRFDERPCGKDLGQNVCGRPSGPHKGCLAFLR